ncbi:HET-domain-containing protein [Colletotrichum somersetense]|nr:HET-domain-containing protein [Colletotrichum somersetense]
MSFSDERLCPNCRKLDLQAVFNPDRFHGLPPIGSAHSHETSWTKYIQHVADWRPLTREERVSFYPPGVIPSCPFCDLVFSISFNLVHYPMAETERIIFAIPANLPYHFAALDEGTSGQGPSTVTSVFLLVMKPSNYKRLSAQYFGNTRIGGGWLTAWIRFAHREAPGSLISIASTVVLEPPQPLLNLPMQARVLGEDRIDFGLIRSWIHLCEHNHDTCRNNPDWRTLPYFKLIDCGSRQIINTDPGKRYRYVALSYVWGTAPPDKYTYPCLPDNLPPVIQDAMRATIKLGFRYIWIDRYCIWQDDLTHKMSQVERMDQIYGDAELSIIAIGAKDPGYGLPGLSLSRTKHAPTTKRIGQQKVVTNFSHHWQLDQISRSKWATRGWTFQETCLSRRRLYFSNYEVSFECHDMMCFEHLTRPLALEGSLEHHERPEWNLLNTPDGVWAILQKYCDRQLTYNSDRLAAVSGVLKKWSRVNPGCSSYWGVPIVASGWPEVDATASKNAFLAGLEWEVRPEATNCARLAGFPSWSWISQNGRTKFGHKGYFHLQPPNLVELTKYFDAEVCVETPQGEVVEWAEFHKAGGLDISIFQWTRYLHIDCWSFQTGPLCHRQIKRRSGTTHDDMFYLPTTRKSSDGKGELALKFTPDFGYEDTFTGRELTAICFAPLEHATCAIVLDSIPGLTVRIGLLAFMRIDDMGSHESQTAEDLPFSGLPFAAQRRRFRLG